MGIQPQTGVMAIHRRPHWRIEPLLIHLFRSFAQACFLFVAGEGGQCLTIEFELVIVRDFAAPTTRTEVALRIADWDELL